MVWQYLVGLLHRNSFSLSGRRSYGRNVKENLKQDGLIMLDRECQYVSLANFCLVTVEHGAERNARSGGC